MIELLIASGMVLVCAGLLLIALLTKLGYVERGDEEDIETFW